MTANRTPLDRSTDLLLPGSPRRSRSTVRVRCARGMYTLLLAPALAGAAFAACRKPVVETDDAIQLGPENVAVVTMARLRSGPVISGTLAPVRDAQIRAQVGRTSVDRFAIHPQTGERHRTIDDDRDRRDPLAALQPPEFV